MSSVMKYLCCCLTSNKRKSSSNKTYDFLYKAKRMNTTTLGHPINKTINKSLLTKQRQREIIKLLPEEVKQTLSEPFSDFSKIIPNLYLTGMGGMNEENISKNDIQFIVNTTHDMPIFLSQGIKSIRIPVEDESEVVIDIYFDEISHFIHKFIDSKRSVVVHCMGGVSRSATIVIAYLMSKQNMNLKKAYEHVWKSRSFIRPNEGFIRQLMKYEQKLFARNSVKMIEDYKGYEIPDIYIKCPQVISKGQSTTTTTTDSTIDSNSMSLYLSTIE